MNWITKYWTSAPMGNTVLGSYKPLITTFLSIKLSFALYGFLINVLVKQVHIFSIENSSIYTFSYRTLSKYFLNPCIASISAENYLAWKFNIFHSALPFENCESASTSWERLTFFWLWVMWLQFSLTFSLTAMLPITLFFNQFSSHECTSSPCSISSTVSSCTVAFPLAL